MIAARLCHGRFAAVAASVPDAPAVIDGQQVVTYAELDERSHRVAGWLQSRGVQPEALVAIMVDRSADLPACALGVWKAGAAYLALSPGTPRRRLRAIADQLGPAALLTHADLRLQGAAMGVPTLLVDQPYIAPQPTPPPGQHPSSLAYVIHTSGSSGAAKGVGVSHASLTAITGVYERMYGLGSKISRVLQLSEFSFDVATGDIARTILTGACLVVCPADVIVSPADLCQLIQARDCQYVEITPSLLRPLVSYLSSSGTRLTSLRFIIVGGEPWPVSEYRALRAVTAPGVRVFNTYGLTEATIDSCFHETHGQYEDGGSIPIGVPFEGTEVAVLDADLRPVDEGELYVSGPQLARGYLNDPAATAGRFGPLPIGKPGVRWLRTGDLVRRLPGGELVHIGRRDDVVKIRGVRLSLAEVQMTLASCPLVRAAAVDSVPARTGQELVAYVVLTDGASAAAAAQIRHHVAARLPRAMIPSRVTVVPALPVTRNGKVDLGALRAAGPGAPAGIDAGADGTAVAGRTELALRKIMARLLRVADVGPDDDFFELGADSLQAAHLAVELRSVLGVELSAAAIHEHRSAAELAVIVQEATAPEAIPVNPGIREAPLAPLQRRLWLQCELAGSASVGNVAILLQFNGRVDVAPLADSLRYLVSRHDALRTAFVRGPDGPVQRVTATSDVEVMRLEMATRASAEAWISREVRRPFDLAAPPLLRGAMVTLPTGHVLLLVIMHHLVSDARSARLLADELGPVYTALSAGRVPELPPVPLRYLDYSRWHAGKLESGAYSRQLNSWCARLRGSATQPAMPGRTGLGAGLRRRQHRLGRWLADDLRSLAREHKATVFVILLAGFAATLHRWTGQEDMVIGVPFGDRDIPGTEQVIGFFVNTAAIRIACPAGSSFADVIRNTRAAVSHARARQDVPFDVVHHHLRRAGTAVAWTSWFNYLGDADRPPLLPGVRTELLDPPPSAALFDVNIYVTQREGGFLVELVHDRAVLDPAAADSLPRRFGRLLALAAADPELPLGQHCLGTGDAATSESGGDACRSGASQPVAASKRPACHRPVADIFAGVARLTPEATAVHGTAGPVTYRQLSRWAAGLSAELGRAGVQPGDLVAVYASRTPSLIACLLAAWSAGASFCILDPAYPAARLAAQLGSCGPVAATLACAPLPGELSGAARNVLTVSGQPLDGPEREPYRAGFPGYVCWTSGTTGMPKRICASGKPLAHFLDLYAREFCLQPGDKFAMCSGLAHDPLLRDIFAPLCAGAAVCIPPDWLLRSGRELASWLAREQVTVLHCTPQLIRLLRAADSPLARMRLIMSSGDQLWAADVIGARELAPSATVVNAYGLTETPQVMAWHVMAPGDPVGAGNRRVPVGAGIDGARLTVRDEDGRQVQAGEQGEIVINSEYLADELGTECRTGDLGRVLPDGQVEVTSRSDDQVKIAGFRAEPGDVDAAVRSLSYIADCHTVAVAGPGREPRLVVYAATVPGTSATIAGLRADLRGLLPAYLIPAGLVVVPSLPLTASGKVDRAGLPGWNPPGAGPDRPAGPEPAPTGLPAAHPQDNTMEARIAEVWRGLLGSRSVPSIDANFFDLGGTSLLMAAAQVRLERALRREVPILTLFEHPTVRALARHFTEEDGPGIGPRRSVLRPVAADARRRLLIRGDLQI